MPDSLNNVVPIIGGALQISEPIATLPTINNDVVVTPVVPRPVPKKKIKTELVQYVCTPIGIQNPLFIRPESYLIYKEKLSNIPVATSAIYGTQSAKSISGTEYVEKIPPKNFANYSIIALILFAIYIAIKLFAKRFSSENLKSTIFYKMANKQFDLRYNKDNKYRNAYHVFYMVVVSVFAFALLNNPTEKFGYLTCLSILCIVFGISLLQIGGVSLSGHITKTDMLAKRLNYERQTICGVVGLLLLPTSIIMILYRDSTIFNILMYVGLFLIIVPVLFVTIRSFICFFNARISGFFWILYLCIFEIAPYSILYFIISDRI